MSVRTVAVPLHPRILAAASCLAMAVVMPVGCQQPAEPLPQPEISKDYDRPLPPGRAALRRLTDPSRIPDFGDAWYKAKGVGLRRAIQHSIDYLKKPSSQSRFPVDSITHEQAMASLEVFLALLDHAGSPEAMNDLVRDNFDVYISVGCDDVGTVLFTSGGRKKWRLFEVDEPLLQLLAPEIVRRYGDV